VLRKKERKKENNNNNNNNKKQSKNNKSPNVVGETKQEMIVTGCRYEVSQAKPPLIYGQSHILRGSKGVGVTIEFYGKVEISYINVANF
jgi:hypothetical protein